MSGTLLLRKIDDNGPGVEPAADLLVRASTALTLPGSAVYERLLTKLESGGSGDVSNMQAAMAGGQSRTLSNKIFERKAANDYYRTTDIGDIAPAIERAAADGNRALFFDGGEVYKLKRPFEIQNGNISLWGYGNSKSEIRLMGNNNYYGIIGRDGAMSYDFGMNGFLFTKEFTSASGAVLKLNNVWRWFFDDIYVYGENKVWRVLELFSSSNGFSRQVKGEQIREKMLYASGGTATGGSPGGWVTDNLFDYWYPMAANNVSTDPANDAVLFFEDNCLAQWITNIKAYSFKGYLIYFKGNAANRDNNALNLVLQPNSEATYTGGGFVRLGNVKGCQIGGPSSWVSSWGLPAIRMDAGSLNNIVRDLQIVASGPVDVIQDFGTYNTVQDMEVTDLPHAGEGSVNAGVAIGSTCVGTKIQRITTNSVLNAIRNDETTNNRGFVIDGVDYYNQRGPVIPGLTSAGTNTVKNIVARGNQGPSNYFVAASTITLPYGKPMYFCYQSGTIDKMLEPGYLGEERRIQFQNGGTVRDIGQSGVAGGAGGFITKTRAATTYATSQVVRFIWLGDYWFEI